MAIEEEFAIEIPDAEADAINSVDQGNASLAAVANLSDRVRRQDTRG